MTSQSESWQRLSHRADKIPLCVVFNEITALTVGTDLFESQPRGIWRHELALLKVLTRYLAMQTASRTPSSTGVAPREAGIQGKQDCQREIFLGPKA